LLVKEGFILFENARIETMDEAYPVAGAMLAMNGVVLHLFREAHPDVSGFYPLRRVDCENLVMLPAFTDAHIHLMDTGVHLDTVDVSAARSEEEAVMLLKEARKDVPAGQWIQGSRWGHNLWEPPRLPSKETLDAAFPQNPVFLFSKCGHLLWVNSPALKEAGIAEHTPDPPGGQIERDANGNPTGILKENAPVLITRVIPDCPAWRKKEFLRKAARHLHRFGIVNVHAPEEAETFSLLQEIRNEPDFRLNVVIYIPVSQLESLVSARIQSGFGDDVLRFGGVKAFVDGSLGGRTAWMEEPYEGEPDNTGMQIATKDELLEMVGRANRAGISVMTHAIGDRAVRTILEVYSETGTVKETGMGGTMNRIEHFQILREGLLPALADSPVAASVQPVHIFSDWSAADRFWGRRARWAYPFRTLLRAGLPLVFGSDSPVEPVNPFWGIYAATLRKDLQGRPPGGWYPEERLSLQESLFAYIVKPPEIVGEGGHKGRLAPGYRADFVLINRAPLTEPPEALMETHVLATAVAGKFVFSEL